MTTGAPMPELPRPAREVIVSAVAGLLLAALTVFGGVIAAIAGWLAQPAFALALSWWRGSRDVADGGRRWLRDALTLGLFSPGETIALPGVLHNLAYVTLGNIIGALVFVVFAYGIAARTDAPAAAR